jgi:transcriptional regulator with XRE-family HTH domain
VISCDLIREARLRAGLSQSQLGRRLGKHPTVISRWERGIVVPSLETLREVVRACGLELTTGLANADEQGHDAALIERSLHLTPAERLHEGVAAFNAIERMVGHATGARGG